MGTGRNNQFYLTLPSNSSMAYYPNNTAANYITHLSSSIALHEGEWEVALVEAHYPNSFLTVSNDAIIYIHMSDVSQAGADGLVPSTAVKLSALKVQPGVYRDIQHLLKEINSIDELRNYGAFTYDQESRLVTITT